jgi:hypothetical protein
VHLPQWDVKARLCDMPHGAIRVAVREVVVVASGVAVATDAAVAPPFGLEPKTYRLTAGCSAN